MNPGTTKQIRISMNETKQQKPDYCDELANDLYKPKKGKNAKQTKPDRYDEVFEGFHDLITEQSNPDVEPFPELEPLPEVLPLPDVVPLPELEPLPKVKPIRLKGESGRKRQRKSMATKPSDKTAKQAKQTKGGKANL